MSTTRDAAEYIRNNPGVGRRKIMAATGCTGFAAEKALKQARAGTAAEPQAGAKSLDDFRRAYDKDTIIPTKIRAGIAALTAKGWEYEAEFAKQSGVSLYDIGRYRGSFEDYVVVIGRGVKRAWAGSAALAKQMREMV